MNRRGFITGILAAPVVITTPGLLMSVRKLIEPEVMTLTPMPGVGIGDLLHIQSGLEERIFRVTNINEDHLGVVPVSV